MIKTKKTKGITIIEILVSVAIIGILGSMSVAVFSRLANSVSLDKDANSIASYIDKARSASINSVDSLEHGVLFATKKVTVFKSTTYSVANTESFYDVSNKSTISVIALSGGVSSLYFDKLTGRASNPGTITVTSADGTQSKVITIYGTGIVDIQ